MTVLSRNAPSDRGVRLSLEVRGLREARESLSEGVMQDALDRMAEALADTEGDLDVGIRGTGGAFGALVRARSPLRGGDPTDPGPGEYDPPGELRQPVMTGRSAMGWTFDQPDPLAADFFSEVEYSDRLRLHGEPTGAATARIEEFVTERWERVGEEMAQILEDALATEGAA